MRPGVRERVGEEYLQHLMSAGSYEEAAALCPTVLGVRRSPFFPPFFSFFFFFSPFFFPDACYSTLLLMRCNEEAAAPPPPPPPHPTPPHPTPPVLGVRRSPFSSPCRLPATVFNSAVNAL